MKKLLLGSAAVALGLAGLSGAAMAQESGVKLDVGGHFKGYVTWLDQDDNLGAGNPEARDFDIVRETELHFSGETTLDNGLTVGAHIESDIDSAPDDDGGNGDAFNTDETYIYMSGAWGRVNVGKEDGAAYLLQVAAPSADSNVDGLRQYVQPVNYSSLLNNGDTNTNIGVLNENTGVELSYDQDVSGKADKLTYMTPVFNGFQGGISYTPELGDPSNGLDGNSLDDEAAPSFGDVIDVAARYEGQFDQLGFTIGAGWTSADAETEGTGAGANATDDRTAWNVGADLDWNAFGIGVAYQEDDNGELTQRTSTNTVDDEEILVVGIDYTTGPFKLGGSYYDSDNSFGVEGLETQRWTGGVTYTYGPGMTFRGSISYLEHDNLDDTQGLNMGATNDADATSILLGTQINF